MQCKRCEIIVQKVWIYQNRKSCFDWFKNKMYNYDIEIIILDSRCFHTCAVKVLLFTPANSNMTLNLSFSPIFIIYIKKWWLLVMAVCLSVAPGRFIPKWLKGRIKKHVMPFFSSGVMGTIDEKIYQKYIVVLSAISRPLFQWVTLLPWYVTGNILATFFFS